MLDPFETKSRANPEKMGRNGPFWMLTQDEFLGLSSYRIFAENRTKVIHVLPAIFLTFRCATLVPEQG